MVLFGLYKITTSNFTQYKMPLIRSLSGADMEASVHLLEKQSQICGANISVYYGIFDMWYTAVAA